MKNDAGKPVGHGLNAAQRRHLPEAEAEAMHQKRVLPVAGSTLFAAFVHGRSVVIALYGGLLLWCSFVKA